MYTFTLLCLSDISSNLLCVWLGSSKQNIWG